MMREAYGPIPDAEMFQHDPGGPQRPIEVHGWDWSTTFGRWSALVTFEDGWHGFTYPTPRRPAVYDASEAIAEIEAKYPDPYHYRPLVRELAQFWGGVKCNEFGVIEPTENVVIAMPSHSKWKARIALAQVPDGEWLIATHYDYPFGNGSTPISVRNRTAYGSKETAIAAGAQELIAIFTKLRDMATLFHADAVLADRMIDKLESLRDLKQQPHRQ